MRSFKTSLKICLHDLRKWLHDHRIWIIAVLLFLLVYDNSRSVIDVCGQIGLKPTIWLYPFLYTQYHQKLIFTIPLIMIFNNAPFIDENALFIISRCKKSTWHIGKFMYIFTASVCYYLYIFLWSVITILPHAELSLEWGKGLRTLASSNVMDSVENSFLTFPKFIITYFTPIQAVWFTFLLSVLMACMLGMIIYFCNLTTGTRYIGCSIASFLILFSCFVESFGKPYMRWYSPVTWATVNKIDVGGTTDNPTFTFCVTILIGVSLTLAVVILVFRKKLKLEARS